MFTWSPSVQMVAVNAYNLKRTISVLGVSQLMVLMG